jgi:hypothetical protein
LRPFRLYRDSDVYTLGTRIGGLGEGSGVARRLNSLIDTGRCAYRAQNVIIQGMVIPSNASVAIEKIEAPHLVRYYDSCQ